MLCNSAILSLAGRPNAPMLVVEDEEPCRRALVNLLHHHGFQAKGVASAEEAWEVLQRDPNHATHLLVVDVDLPGMCGMDLVKKVRATMPEMHAVMVTAADRDMVQRFCDQNAVSYFPKPLDVPGFLRHIDPYPARQAG
jgi:DNA-binding NtrC family response regulator